MARNLNGVVVVLLAVATLLHGSAAHTKHVVGDSTGWTIPSGGAATYATWAADKTFSIGDTLEFNYQVSLHNVEEVTKENFDSCNSASPLATYDNPPVSVTLNEPGPHYFICGVTEHCSLGQKLAINVIVADTSTATPSSSTATPPSSTATSPSSATFFSPPSPAGAGVGAAFPPPPHKSDAASLGLFSATLLSIAAAFFY